VNRVLSTIQIVHRHSKQQKRKQREPANSPSENPISTSPSPSSAPPQRAKQFLEITSLQIRNHSENDGQAERTSVGFSFANYQPVHQPYMPTHNFTFFGSNIGNAWIIESHRRQSSAGNRLPPGSDDAWDTLWHGRSTYLTDCSLMLRSKEPGKGPCSSRQTTTPLK
jgi:hypothetical protein